MKAKSRKECDFISIQEAGDVLGVSTRHKRRLCAQNTIHGAIKIKSQWRLPPSYVVSEGDCKTKNMGHLTAGELFLLGQYNKANIARQVAKKRLLKLFVNKKRLELIPSTIPTTTTAAITPAE